VPRGVSSEILIVGTVLLMLIGAQWMLSSAIIGTN
jgi:hypothetical protein